MVSERSSVLDIVSVSVSKFLIYRAALSLEAVDFIDKLDDTGNLDMMPFGPRAGITRSGFTACVRRSMSTCLKVTLGRLTRHSVSLSCVRLKPLAIL